MLKLLFLGLNILNVFNYSNEVNYIPIIQEFTVYEEVLYSDDIYVVYIQDNEIFLKTQNDEWIRKLDVNRNINVYLVNKDLYIYNYLNGKLECLIYNIDGELVNRVELFNNKLDNYKIVLNNDFYIIGSVSVKEADIFKGIDRDGLGLKDGFIIKIGTDLIIKEVKLFGGLLNDKFYDISIFNESIYIAGKKDVLSGGDFGNGGKKNGDIFVLELSSDLEIIKYQIVNDDSKIIKLEYYKDNLYLSSSNYIYKFNNDFDIVYSNKLDENAIYAKVSSFNKLVVFASENTYVYDLFNLRLIDKISNEVQIESIREYIDTLYINASGFKYFDIASLEDIKYIDKVYKDYSSELNVKTLFGEATYVDEVSDVGFISLIYGIYQRTFKFNNKFGLEFLVNRETEVLKEVNVSEGGIYPVGYNLKFTGNAYLNDESILNNYSIPSSGAYSLKLVGVDGSSYVVNFRVENDQIAFNETSINNYHTSVLKNEVFYLKIKYNDSLENIESVIINEKTYSDLIINSSDNTISIKMTSVELPGINYYLVNSINYRDGDILRSIQVNDIYVVNVLENVMELDISRTEGYKYFVEVRDSGTARYFEVMYTYQNNEYIQKYPLSSNKIYLDELPRVDTINIKLALVYDLGDKVYRKIELMELEYSDLSNNNVLEIDVLKKESSLSEFEVIIMNEKSLKQIISNEVVLYQSMDKDYKIHIAIGVILLVIITTVIYRIRYYRFRKKIGL